MTPDQDYASRMSRRYFFGKTATGLGSLGLASLLNTNLFAGKGQPQEKAGGLPDLPHFPPKVKRVIYLFQSGGPSQMDLFDHKPDLKDLFGKEVPESVYPPDRKTTMSAGQTSFPVAPSKFKFSQHGDSGMWFSELLPHLAGCADDICMVNSASTEAINHDPAITFLQTGSQLAGRPSIGAWLSYGLGSENEDLPTFVAMSSRGSGKKGGQPLYNRLWGSGFLPAVHQGVKFRNQGAPVLDIKDPAGVSRSTRRLMLDHLAKMNQLKYEEVGDPDIQTRIAQYELAYQMQTSVPELLEFSQERKETIESYGPDVHRQGSYAYNCLTAARLADRGVRFIQLFHQGWDQHGNVAHDLPAQCRDTDQPTAALIKDLKARGLFEDTLIVWGGEFGRTVYSQGELTKKNYGRDHHPGCFTVLLAGGGVKGGLTYGKTDDFSVGVVEDKVHVHDLHATILHLLGINHKRLTYKHQGRSYRLTDLAGQVVKGILA